MLTIISRVFAFPIRQAAVALTSSLAKSYQPPFQQFQQPQQVRFVTRLWTRGDVITPQKKPRNKTAKYRAMLKVMTL